MPGSSRWLPLPALKETDSVGLLTEEGRKNGASTRISNNIWVWMNDTVDGKQKSSIQQLRLVVYHIISKVFYIPGGCLGFLNHQQYFFGINNLGFRISILGASMNKWITNMDISLDIIEDGWHDVFLILGRHFEGFKSFKSVWCNTKMLSPGDWLFQRVQTYSPGTKRLLKHCLTFAVTDKNITLQKRCENGL